MNEQDLPPIPDSWTLDTIMESAAKTHVPITAKHLKRTETRMVSFRMSPEDHRRMQKIIQQRRTKGIETYSDLINDALFGWFEKYYEDNPTADPAAAQELHMIRLNAERSERNEFLQLSQKVLSDLTEDRHIKGLDKFITAMVEAKYSYINQDAPDDFVKRLDELLTRARRLLDESK